jgi:hypothetical protein
MTPGTDFPRLTSVNHRITSPPSPDYNCIAWAAGESGRWWEPVVYWPATTPPGDYGIAALTLAFEALGYLPCGDGGAEPGFEKVALYGDGMFYTHAARQLLDGKWTSKLGAGEDIEHDAPEDVAGGLYGEVALFMRRAGARLEPKE